MARQSLIDKHGLQDVVAAAVAEDKSLREIAKICTKLSGASIGHLAIDRYLKSLDQREDEKPVKEKEKPPIRPLAKKQARQVQVERIVESGIDIINLQYRTTSVLVDKFETIIDLPDAVEGRLQSLEEDLTTNGVDTKYLGEWRLALVNDLRRNITSIATINRELRENSKFIVELREKAFTLNLAQEFIDHFTEIFQRQAPEAYDRAMLEVAANPRLQRIVEQQLRGVAG